MAKDRALDLAAGDARKKLQEVEDRIDDMKRTAKAENRELSRRESAEIRTLAVVAEVVRRELDDLDRRGAFDPRKAQEWRDGARIEDGRPPTVLRREERVSDWCESRGMGLQGFSDSMRSELDDPSRFSLGRQIRGWISGQWDADSELERRSLQESVAASGGYLLPAPLSSRVIDLVRNQMQTMKAGVVTMPMELPTLALPRLTAGPGVEWHAESSPVNFQTESFDRVTLSAKLVETLVKISVELFLDVPSESAALIENALVQAIAVEIDRVILRGDPGATPAQPTGVLHQAGVTLTAFGGANGGSLASWDTLVDAASTVRNNNMEPSAFILAPRSEQSLAKIKTTMGDYVAPPASIAEIARLTTNQIPTNLTVGTSSDCSEVYCGDFSQTVLGWRLGVGFGQFNPPSVPGSESGQTTGAVRVLDERFADTLEVGLICMARVDVGLLHPQAFDVVTGIRP
jgi:HK97 family phage major capsid protein